jgi:transcriptional regulator with XRE-family HTH domain
MKDKRQLVFPKYNSTLETIGENVKMARKRRKLTTMQLAERAGIARSTLYQIESGNPSVAFRAYFNVLRVMGLQGDFLKLASDDVFGRKLEDLELLK